MLELGWTRERLASSSSEVVAAARWKLFVASLWPADLVATLNAPEPPKDQKGRENWERQQRMASRKLIESLHALIFPTDEEPDSDA